jgi:hypothetical protein
MTSTVRFQLSEQDRSRFIDLLALAGDSRFPGTVCAGYESGDRGPLLGYPLTWLAETMRCTPDELAQSLKKLTEQGRISVEGKEGFPVIKICSWKKYQSEYLRQIQSVTNRARLQTSAQLGKRSHETSTHPLAQEVEGEGEGEVDVEGEGEGEKKKSAPATPSHFVYENALLKVTEKQDAILGEAFPWVDREREYRFITSWLEANPNRRPKKASRFLHNWFARIPAPNVHGKTNAAEERTKRNLRAAGLL